MESKIKKPLLVADDLKKAGVLVVEADGKTLGRTAGKHRACTLEGCTGLQIGVERKGHKRTTWVCTKALTFMTRMVKLVE